MSARRKGFTLIELLVVIAIIAILAAMLFPVFARARESARKIQCLSNVKNIALAVQIYLTDYDRFPPSEFNPEVVAYFNARGGADCCCRSTLANPYLRWPVILDEYTRNRDVWRCPSAGTTSQFGINGSPGGDWFGYLKAHLDDLVASGDPERGHSNSCALVMCSMPYPPGWGGSITDTMTQKQCAGTDSGGFDLSIGYNTGEGSVRTFLTKPGQIKDPAKFVVAADSNPTHQGMAKATWIAFPDACVMDCVDCSWDPRLQTDMEYLKHQVPPRHLGGSNIGFADGHAAWMPSQVILVSGENWRGPAQPSSVGRYEELLEGIGVCGTWGL